MEKQMAVSKVCGLSGVLSRIIKKEAKTIIAEYDLE
jgi:hypothetical protein